MLEVTRYSFEEMLEKHGFVAYTCSGCSMMPLIRQRKDIVEIRAKNPKNRCKRYDVVLYKQGDYYVLHRVLRVRPDDYVICGDHNIKCEYGITDNQILGVMTRLVRNGKSINVKDNKLYKLYVHIWVDFYWIRVLVIYYMIFVNALRNRIKRYIKRK